MTTATKQQSSAVIRAIESKHPVKGPALNIRLRELKKVANENHRQSKAAWRGALDYARKSGEALLEAKWRLGKRGKWTRWLTENFEASKSTARVYMRIAAHWDDDRLRAARESAIEVKSIKSALQFLRDERDEPKHANRNPDDDKEPNENELLKATVKAHFWAELSRLTTAELAILRDRFPELWKDIHRRVRVIHRLHRKQQKCRHLKSARITALESQLMRREHRKRNGIDKRDKKALIGP